MNYATVFLETGTQLELERFFPVSILCIERNAIAQFQWSDRRHPTDAKPCRVSQIAEVDVLTISINITGVQEREPAQCPVSSHSGHRKLEFDIAHNPLGSAEIFSIAIRIVLDLSQ